MFEGLDQIDWTSLGHHIYSKSEQIPHEIRNLLSQNEEVRQEARDFLLGGGQDFGDIYDTTPHIIPFLFEILDSPNAPDKDKLLYHLSDVADHSFNPTRSSYRMLRLNSLTYDAIKAGLGVLIDLLDDPALEVRVSDTELLGLMTNDAENVIPELIRRFQEGPEEEMQVALLKSLKNLLHFLDWRYSELRVRFAPFFQEVVETHPSHNVRIAAAHASVELLAWSKGKQTWVSPSVSALLSEELFDASIALDYKDRRSSFTEAESIADDLSRLNDRQALLVLMQKPDLSPELAHLIARALLAAAFLLSDTESHWRHSPDYDRSADGLFYLQHFDVKSSLRPRIGYKIDRPFLRAILDAEKVWEIPTNLFSFFYGLPDTREGLRALLEELDAKYGKD